MTYKDKASCGHSHPIGFHHPVTSLSTVFSVRKMIKSVEIMANAVTMLSMISSVRNKGKFRPKRGGVNCESRD